MSSMMELACLRLTKMLNEIEVNIKMMAHHVVTRENTVAVPRGPNAAWLPVAPKVAARSALFPCWRSTTTIRIAHTMTWMKVIKPISIF